MMKQVSSILGLLVTLVVAFFLMDHFIWVYILDQQVKLVVMVIMLGAATGVYYSIAQYLQMKTK